MKIYNTQAGVLLEKSGEFRLDTEADWDDLINQYELSLFLSKRYDELPPYQDFEQLLLGVQLPPMQSQELWASGVTYLRSKEERQEESKEAEGGDFYQRVYEAERPELFFKANRQRTVGHRDKVRIRTDSSWDVPEPELALVLNKHGDIVGYTIGNDMSSRSIEGENPLYLPQAKTYDRCAALGPCVYVVQGPLPKETIIRMSIVRNNSDVFIGEISTSMITRSFEELSSFLFRECSFPYGVILMTGTGIVPENSFTLCSGDEIIISIDHIGTLSNSVA